MTGGPIRHNLPLIIIAEPAQFQSDRLEPRLDRFLAARCPELSRARIQALIRSNHILRNGLPCKASEPVYPADTVSVDLPETIAADPHKAEDIPLAILHEDADLIVINKPPGIVVHPGAGNLSGTLVNALLHHCGALSVIGGEERPGIVHRLDKETSGCLVVAKNDVAHRHLAAQFADRSVAKVYLAICRGKPRNDSGTVDAAISRHAIHRQRMTVSDRPGAKPAVTDWKLLVEKDGLCLLECHPHTGRTHQIRVHLKHIKLPIVGDPVYGKRENYPRHLLHAWKLSFTHPQTAVRHTFEASLPDDFPLVPPAAKSKP